MSACLDLPICPCSGASVVPSDLGRDQRGDALCEGRLLLTVATFMVTGERSVALGIIIKIGSLFIASCESGPEKPGTGNTAVPARCAA